MNDFPTFRPLDKSSDLYNMIYQELMVSNDSQFVIDELGTAIASNRGLRRERNEDRIVVARTMSLVGERFTVAIVCDGVGGSESGEQAAVLTLTSILCDLTNMKSSLRLRDIAIAVVQRADEHVRTELKGRGSTTLVMVLASSNGDLVCANVGDSRVYSWRKQSPRLLKQISMDDTVENELKNIPGNHNALIFDRGLQGRLSQAVGEDGRTVADLKIQIYGREYFPEGVVLGSDGLWRISKDFEAVIAHSTTPSDAIRRAIALATWVGGVDNSSLIVIDDIKTFCNSNISNFTKPPGTSEINLWCSSVKSRILFAERNNKDLDNIKSSSVEKPKRAPKKKFQKSVSENKQLKLDVVDNKLSKPKIEITESNDNQSDD